MWIIEDMFKSRKGFELKNSLTEYIPDTMIVFITIEQPKLIRNIRV